MRISHTGGVGVGGSNPLVPTNFFLALRPAAGAEPSLSEPPESFIALRGFAAPLGGSNRRLSDQFLLGFAPCFSG